MAGSARRWTRPGGARAHPDGAATAVGRSRPPGQRGHAELLAIGPAEAREANVPRRGHGDRGAARPRPGRTAQPHRAVPATRSAAALGRGRRCRARRRTGARRLARARPGRCRRTAAGRHPAHHAGCRRRAPDDQADGPHDAASDGQRGAEVVACDLRRAAGAEAAVPGAGRRGSAGRDRRRPRGRSGRVGAGAARSLEVGETAIIETSTRLVDLGGLDTTYFDDIDRRMFEVVIWVRFDPEVVPTRCVQTRRPWRARRGDRDATSAVSTASTWRRALSARAVSG